MADSTVHVRAADLTVCLEGVFVRLGLSEDNAALCAADMVLTNLWGIDSHGVLRLPIYAQRLENKVISGNPEVSTIGGRGAFEVMDGDRGIGYVVGHAAMARAVALAQTHGIGAVTVTNSNHFGAAALYARQAAEAGHVSLCMTNVIPNLVVPGGAKPITGNNPIAFGAPTRLGFPLLLDISMSSVAGGKLLLAKEKGLKIPLDWATDREGHPTDDPAVGFAGFLLPLGGHKGFGLSLMVDLLCGVIPNGPFQHALMSMYAHPEQSSGTGHMMIALDPTIMSDVDSFLDRMDAFYHTVKTSPMRDPTAHMYIPGEIENETRSRRLRDGIPLPASLYNQVRALAERLGSPDLPAIV